MPAAAPRGPQQSGLRTDAGSRPSRATIAARVAAISTAQVPAAPRTHTVQSGDNLWSLSRQYGVTVEQLASANRLALTSILTLGHELAIPSSGDAPAPAQPAVRTAAAQGSTQIHVVQSGETLWDIAGRYGARVEDLMTLNDLGHDDWIKPGQRLVVSGRAVPRYRLIAEQNRGRAGEFRSEPVMADSAILRNAGAFLWPSRGMITSRFGWRYHHHHDGIDIASPRGTPIYATRDGVVEFAGWKGGYGRVVFVDHGSGLVTIYGHASELLVQPGQRVKKGQLIARVGCTGACTGSHVHFEVRVNDRAVDPLPFLN